MSIPTSSSDDASVLVDVVILAWDDPLDLARAVASVRASVGAVATRLIVVDNGSAPPIHVDGENLTLVRNSENRGVAGGRNQGARLGSSPLICFLDSDAELDPDCLDRLAAVLTEERTVGLAAPVFHGQSPLASAGRAPTLGRKLLRLAGLTSQYREAGHPNRGPWWEVDFAIGACQLIRRTAFERVGGLDEAYFYGPEDVDFCLRLRDAGWKVVQVPAAGCHHPPRRRFRNPLSRRGANHAAAVLRHLWRRRHSGGQRA